MAVMRDLQSRRGIRGAKIAWQELQGWYWAGFALSSVANADLSVLVNYTSPARARWDTYFQLDYALYKGYQWTIWCFFWVRGSVSDWPSESCAQTTTCCFSTSSFYAWSSEATRRATHRWCSCSANDRSFRATHAHLASGHLRVGDFLLAVDCLLTEDFLPYALVAR